MVLCSPLQYSLAARPLAAPTAHQHATAQEQGQGSACSSRCAASTGPFAACSVADRIIRLTRLANRVCG